MEACKYWNIKTFGGQISSAQVLFYLENINANICQNLTLDIRR